MSDLLAKHLKSNKKDEDEGLSDQELRARQKIIEEAKKAGATLERPEAKGGLPPSMVLGMFRRDEWRCKGCGTKENIGPHHKSGIITSKWASKKGHTNTLNNLATLCKNCHNKAHTEAREQGIDSSQVLAEGDIGTRHDKGQPLATPKS